ncbi:MAG: hypothetical protein GVY22_10360 [Gammaproteobacteria bacterium]|jgi:hypothetical protein|nr:hypothetical protein [Gammaproteobacteria bacterium]
MTVTVIPDFKEIFCARRRSRKIRGGRASEFQLSLQIASNKIVSDDTPEQVRQFAAKVAAGDMLRALDSVIYRANEDREAAVSELASMLLEAPLEEDQEE